MQKLAMVLFFSVFVLGVGASNGFANCAKNEIFSAFGFYKNGGFPQYTELVGPFESLEQCQKMEKLYKNKEQG